MIDFNIAIEDVTSYRDKIVSLRNALNKGEDISVNQRTDFQTDYEVLVRPHVEALEMQEPGEKEWHGYILKFNNPVEWAIKENSFFSLNNAIPFLNRLLGRLKYYKAHPNQFPRTQEIFGNETSLSNVRKVIRMFDASAKLLANRRMGKTPFLIEDEYDVQDILHCVLKSQFPDIKKEEGSPSIANGGKRIDLVIPSAKIVIEIKIVLKKTKTSRIVDELKIDIESYYLHPACGTLVCFIYNPENSTEDPENIISDLSGVRTIKDHVFDVVVEVYPR